MQNRKELIIPPSNTELLSEFYKAKSDWIKSNTELNQEQTHAMKQYNVCYEQGRISIEACA